MTITDFRYFDPVSSGRRPLLIALLMYSLGFVGAGLLLWRSGTGCAPRVQGVDDEIVCWHWSRIDAPTMPDWDPPV